MSRLAVVLVACLVLTAGCGGFSASSNDPAPDREPYGVEEPVNASTEEEEEETEGERLLPGLTTEGLTDVANLQTAHRDAIGNETFTVRTETLYDPENGSEPQLSETTTYVDPGNGTVFGVIQINQSDTNSESNVTQNPLRSAEQWYGEETLARLKFENGTVEYPPMDDQSESRNRTILEAVSRPLTPLQSIENTTTVGAVDAEDGTYYVLEGSANSTSALENSTVIRETHVRTLVREDGLVRQTVLEQTYTEDGERTTINETVEIVDIGETTVERPDWYDEALAAQPEESESSESGGSNETPGGAGAANET